MTRQFQHHYTVEEARALLPQIRTWLEEMAGHRRALQRSDGRLKKLLAEGHDVGGARVTGWIKAYARLKALLGEFQRREIFLKDVDRGLIDFPALLQGREVFLCWEKDEPDIEFWHDLDAGYAGREPL